MAQIFICVAPKYYMTSLGEGIIREAGCAAINVVDHALDALGAERRQYPSTYRRVLVIPGYLQRGEAPYTHLIKNFRKEDGVEVVSPDTRFWRDLRDSSQRVIDYIIGMNGNGEIIDALVGHSMGGLVATKVAQTPGIKERVRNVICLATPFGGTPAAYLGIATRSARQMIPTLKLFGVVLRRNEFLDELEEGEYSPNTNVVHIYGQEDWIVPAKSAAQGKAHEKISLPKTGHFSILYDNRVHEKIRESVLKSQENPPTDL